MSHVARLAGAFVLLICSVCAAYAATDDQSPQPGAAAPPTKKPPPPLFPKHRRGIYRNGQGIEVVDATPQSPPLDTDDPNVPATGEWEINLLTFADHSKATRRVDVLRVDANYGMLPKIAGHGVPTQLKFEFPVAAARATGDPYRVGVGAAKVGLKFNVYADEHIGLSVSVYPQVEFTIPGSRAVGKNLAEPGQIVILPLLVSKEFHDLTFVANGGLEQPIHDPDAGLAGTFGVGFGRALTRRLAAMLEVGGESAVAAGGERTMFFNLGVIRGVRHVVVYANWGHGFAFGDQNPAHSFFGAGIKLLSQSAQKR